MNLVKEVIHAKDRIEEYIRETPVEHSSFLSELGNCQVFLKLENMQLTSSFKIRGALNKLLQFQNIKPKPYFITASSGNHGVAFAHAINTLGYKGEIYLPENSSKVKIDALKKYKVKVNFHGLDCVEAENYARKVAEKENSIYVSPYNDLHIISGQGTIGMELEKQLKDIDLVLVPVGGGGLISGIASYLKNKNEKIEIIGCQPESSPTMYESIKANKIVEIESKPTFSDGSAGGIEQNAITFDLCKKYVDDYIIVTEEEIKEAIKIILSKQYMLVEGAAALSVASYIKKIEKFRNKRIVLIISGAKIGTELLKQILCD